MPHGFQECSNRTPATIVFDESYKKFTQLQAWAMSHSSTWASHLLAPAPECSQTELWSYRRGDRNSTALSLLSKDYGVPGSLRALQIIATVHAPLLSTPLREAVRKLRPGDRSNDFGREVLKALRNSLHVRKDLPGMDCIKVQKAIFSEHTFMEKSSFIKFPGASDEFCQDNNDSTDVGPPLKTAVCFVGISRTMLRPDVRESLLYRFLAGWGLQTLSVFAVLLKIDSDVHYAKVFAQLSRFNTTAVEWYHDTITEYVEGRNCADVKEVKQLKQWSQCMTMIEAHKRKNSMLFDAAIKIRPDDYWYGAMLPYCALNLKTNAYISRQETRWSDQWFALPRKRLCEGLVLGIQ